jgi:hypothetical protein
MKRSCILPLALVASANRLIAQFVSPYYNVADIGSSQTFVPLAMNNSGTIVGDVPSGTGGGHQAAVLESGVLTVLNSPLLLSRHPIPGSTAVGINDRGAVVGPLFQEDRRRHIHLHQWREPVVCVRALRAGPTKHAFG